MTVALEPTSAEERNFAILILLKLSIPFLEISHEFHQAFESVDADCIVQGCPASSH
jgi:hypothetical protein